MRDLEYPQPFARRSSGPAALGLALLLPAALLISAGALPQSGKAKRPKPSADAGVSVHPVHSVHTVHSPATAPGFDTTVAPFVKKYCIACHSGSSAQAAIVLGREKDAAGVLKNRKTWEAVS